MGSPQIVTPTSISSSVAGTYSSHADHLIDGTEWPGSPPDIATYNLLEARCFVDHTSMGDKMWLTGVDGLSQQPVLMLTLDGWYQVRHRPPRRAPSSQFRQHGAAFRRRRVWPSLPAAASHRARPTSARR